MIYLATQENILSHSECTSANRDPSNCTLSYRNTATNLPSLCTNQHNLATRNTGAGAIIKLSNKVCIPME